MIFLTRFLIFLANLYILFYVYHLHLNKCECSEKDCKNQITIFNTKFNHTLRTDPKNVYTVNSLIEFNEEFLEGVQ